MPTIEKVRSKTIYRGRTANLSLDTFRTSDGRSFFRETIQHPPSVVILPLTVRGEVLLIRQYRHAVGRWICEIPAGTSEPGEPLLRCAKRELGEETGHRATGWRRVCEFYPAPGISTERMALYVATGAVPIKRGTLFDEDEHIALLPASPAKALRMVRENTIVDAKSIIGILWGLGRIRW
ncbi:MAG: NUDIX hydrolase [Candidatus Omnitrophica bacterium]|nr:NUDIX hydrolase [Candidatus Omnitrophota bacterium]